MADSSAASEATAKLIAEMRAEDTHTSHTPRHVNTTENGSVGVWEICAGCTEHFWTAEGAPFTQNRQLHREKCY